MPGGGGSALTHGRTMWGPPRWVGRRGWSGRWCASWGVRGAGCVVSACRKRVRQPTPRTALGMCVGPVCATSRMRPRPLDSGPWGRESVGRVVANMPMTRSSLRVGADGCARLVWVCCDRWSGGCGIGCAGRLAADSNRSVAFIAHLQGGIGGSGRHPSPVAAEPDGHTRALLRMLSDWASVGWTASTAGSWVGREPGPRSSRRSCRRGCTDRPRARGPQPSFCISASQRVLSSRTWVCSAHQSGSISSIERRPRSFRRPATNMASRVRASVCSATTRRAAASSVECGHRAAPATGRVATDLKHSPLGPVHPRAVAVLDGLWCRSWAVVASFVHSGSQTWKPGSGPSPLIATRKTRAQGRGGAVWCSASDVLNPSGPRPDGGSLGARMPGGVPSGRGAGAFPDKNAPVHGLAVCEPVN